MFLKQLAIGLAVIVTAAGITTASAVARQAPTAGNNASMQDLAHEFLEQWNNMPQAGSVDTESTDSCVLRARNAGSYVLTKDEVKRIVEEFLKEKTEALKAGISVISIRDSDDINWGNMSLDNFWISQGRQGACYPPVIPQSDHSRRCRHLP
jgi:hypothetical protein